MPEEQPAAPRNVPGFISLTLPSLSALYAAYMPFLKNGGFFVPTNAPYKMGDEIFLMLAMKNELERIPITGSVVWITPQGAQNKRPQGVGVMFKNDENSKRGKLKIEQKLGTLLNSLNPTHTL